MRSTYPLVFVLALSLACPLAARGQEEPSAAEDPNLVNQENQEAREEEQRRLDREAAERIQRALGQRVDDSVRRGVGIQVRRIAHTDLIAVLHDIDLEGEFLMVRLRFFNDGPTPARLVIDPASAYESFFVEVGDEKRFIQRDDRGTLDAKRRLEVDIRPGAMASWWARFPALPADARYFHIVIPPVPPFLNVPVDAD